MFRPLKTALILIALLAYSGPATADKCGQLCDWAFWQSASQRDIEAAIANAPDIKARDDRGHTPLHYAAANGKTEAITALLRRGADIEARDEVGFTPLHAAALGSNTETINTLLRNGAYINSKSDSDITPLHAAASLGTAEVVEALLQAGANPTARTNDGATPYDWAKQNFKLLDSRVLRFLAQANGY